MFEAGAEGVQELPGEVVTHFRHVDPDSLTSIIRNVVPHATIEFAPTPETDWSKEWRSSIGAHRLGHLVVTPPWLADSFTDSERIVIEPGMAFGTGEHETTRGVIRLLPGVIRPDCTVADLGAGSAVLSVVAARLGAKRVVAIENDPDAIGNANENVSRNGVAAIVTVIEGDAAALLPLIAPVDLVLANIISSVLVELLPVIAQSLAGDGAAILSGILLEERAAMEEVLRRTGWRVRSTDEEGNWWSVVIARR